MQITSSRGSSTREIMHWLKTSSSEEIKLGEHVERKLQWEKKRTTIFNLSSDNGFHERLLSASGYWWQPACSRSKQLQHVWGAPFLDGKKLFFFQFECFWNWVTSYKWSLSSSPEKLLLKRLCLKNWWCFTAGSLGRRFWLIHVQEVDWGRFAESLPVGEGKKAEMGRGRREATLHSVTGFCGAGEPVGPLQLYKLGNNGLYDPPLPSKNTGCPGDCVCSLKVSPREDCQLKTLASSTPTRWDNKFFIPEREYGHRMTSTTNDI